MSIDEKLITSTAKKIKEKTKYTKFSSQIEAAKRDIVAYFDELELYEYLNRVRNLELDVEKNK